MNRCNNTAKKNVQSDAKDLKMKTQWHPLRQQLERCDSKKSISREQSYKASRKKQHRDI